MKARLLLLLALCLSLNSFSQVNQELLNRLNKPIVNCETVVYNAQKIISGYQFTQKDSIVSILKAWEELCGISEPTMRMRILLEIQDSTFAESKGEEYLNFFLLKFKRRLFAAEYPNYTSLYHSAPESYDFVPINEAFDKFTKEFAFYLIDGQADISLQHILCTLFTENIEAFDVALNARNYKQNNSKNNAYRPYYNTYSYRTPNIFNYSSGIFIPTGKLGNNLRPAPFIGIGIGGTLANKYYLALDMKAVILSEKDLIDIKTNHDTTTTVNSLVSIGLNLTRWNKVGKQLFLNISLGAGYNSISTDLIKKLATSRKQDDTYYSINTADFNAGAELRHIFKKGWSLAAFTEWHYAPYNWDKKTFSTLGNQYYLTGLSVRF